MNCLKHDFLLFLIHLTELNCWQILWIFIWIWSNSCKKYRNIQKVDFPKIRSSEAFWEILPKLYYLQTEASILRLFVCRSWKILWSFINTQLQELGATGSYVAGIFSWRCLTKNEHLEVFLFLFWCKLTCYSRNIELKLLARRKSLSCTCNIWTELEKSRYG